MKAQNPTRRATTGVIPHCDGRPVSALPPDDSIGEIKREFVEAYRRINVAYAKRMALRRARRLSAQERVILQEIEKAICQREKLDRACAPRGIVATPVYENGLTVDIRFQHATANRRRLPSPISSSSRYLTFSLPSASPRRR